MFWLVWLQRKQPSGPCGRRGRLRSSLWRMYCGHRPQSGVRRVWLRACSCWLSDRRPLLGIWGIHWVVSGPWWSPGGMTVWLRSVSPWNSWRTFPKRLLKRPGKGCAPCWPRHCVLLWRGLWWLTTLWRRYLNLLCVAVFPARLSAVVSGLWLPWWQQHAWGRLLLGGRVPRWGTSGRGTWRGLSMEVQLPSCRREVCGLQTPWDQSLFFPVQCLWMGVPCLSSQFGCGPVSGGRPPSVLRRHHWWLQVPWRRSSKCGAMPGGTRYRSHRLSTGGGCGKCLRLLLLAWLRRAGRTWTTCSIDRRLPGCRLWG